MYQVAQAHRRKFIGQFKDMNAQHAQTTYMPLQLHLQGPRLHALLPVRPDPEVFRMRKVRLPTLAVCGLLPGLARLLKDFPFFLPHCHCAPSRRAAGNQGTVTEEGGLGQVLFGMFQGEGTQCLQDACVYAKIRHKVQTLAHTPYKHARTHTDTRTHAHACNGTAALSRDL